jgi:signal transduction histidine kinase
VSRWAAGAGLAGGALCALLAAGLFVLGLPLAGASRPGYAAFATATLLVFTLACFVVAAVVAARSREPMALYAAAMLAVVGGAGAPYTDALAGRPGLFLPARLGTYLFPLLVVGFLLVFPTGRPVPRWAAAPYAAWALVLLVVMLATPPYPPGNPPDLWGLLMAIGFVGGLACAGWRWRRVSDPVARAQTRWVLLGLATAIAATLTGSFVPALAPGSAGAAAGFAVVTLGTLALPVSVAIAVTRFRLWDVDLVINRAAVYSAVATILLALYLGIVLSAEAVLAGRDGELLALAAAGVVAVALQPLRLGVQRVVNRLMYGDRDDPRGLLHRLAETLDESVAGDSVLPRIATTVATALRLPNAAVALRDGSVFAASGPAEPGAAGLLRVPLVHQGEELGELRLAPRSARDPFTPRDLELVRELAVHVAAAAHAVLLDVALRQSRERLVTARAEERRRLRRDLHDGLGPQLVSLALKLEAARNRGEADARMRDLLTALATQTRGVIADIRRLVYALRPPALDELGLLGALAQVGEAAGDGLDFAFERPERMPPLPAAVEVAAYRIAQEALTNVVRHSGARRCTLSLALTGGGVRLEVTDDGSGIGPGARAGVGLSSMRERAEELGGRLEIGSAEGGGGRIVAFLPCAGEA